MLNEHDMSTWREEMITVAQAREALENMDDYARMADINSIGPYHVLSEFIKQYEDWVKVKTMTHGVLLKGKDE